MKILFLTQWFNPEPAFKGLAFAKELESHGNKVTVLTGFPNYPGGKLYDGYKLRLYSRETLQGIDVIRVPLYPSHDSNLLRRFINYISFALSALLIGGLTTDKPDVIYVYHAPASIGLPAIILGWLKKAPFIYDINDLWPDSLFSTGMIKNGIVMRIIDCWCRLIYRCAAKVTVVTLGFKERLISRGVPAEKIEMIFNWSDDTEIHFEKRNETLYERLGMAGHFNILFAGNMGKAQALDAVLSAAAIVSDLNPNVQFVFIGGGIEVNRLRKLADINLLNNVLFLPRVPYSEIGAILVLADVLLVHLKDDPLFEITIPSKTLSYLAAGRPILMGVKGDSADLVEKAQAGFVCLPENAEDIAVKVMKIAELPSCELEQLGENGRRYYEQYLSLSVGAYHFSNVFKSIVK